MQLRKLSISAYAPASEFHQMEILPAQRPSKTSPKLQILLQNGENSEDMHDIPLEVTFSERMIFITCFDRSLFCCSVLALSILNLQFSVDNRFLTSFQTVHKSNRTLFLGHSPSLLFFLFLLVMWFLLSEMLVLAIYKSDQFRCHLSNKPTLVSSACCASCPFCNTKFDCLLCTWNFMFFSCAIHFHICLLLNYKILKHTES